MGLRKIALLVGLAFPVLAGAGIMNFFSGFTVEREVVIEPQQYTKHGKLARAADGGYFVLGEGTLPWIVKTDATGNVLRMGCHWQARRVRDNPPHCYRALLQDRDDVSPQMNFSRPLIAFQFCMLLFYINFI